MSLDDRGRACLRHHRGLIGNAWWEGEYRRAFFAFALDDLNINVGAYKCLVVCAYFCDLGTSSSPPANEGGYLVRACQLCGVFSTAFINYRPNVWGCAAGTPRSELIPLSVVPMEACRTS